MAKRTASMLWSFPSGISYTHDPSRSRSNSLRRNSLYASGLRTGSIAISRSPSSRRHTDTIDERIMQILANKRRIFDAFADRSVAAEQVDQVFSRETMDQIVRDELRKYAGAR